MQTVLVTGAGGFIAGYLIPELLANNYRVIGLDNHWKYGPVSRSFDNHPNYKFYEGDAQDVSLLKELLKDCDHFIAGAAIIGGIALFHKIPYDILATNERITASACDAAIWAYKHRKLKKITMISSSMVFENATTFPTPEGEQLRCPPPSSSYGFQKLACEYFVRAAYQQYGLPFTIVRPFNCIGIGEKRAKLEHCVMSGNIKLAMSHVVPDLIQKILKGQDPLHILGDGTQVRCYTYAGDIARGILATLETDAAINEDFNISTSTPTTVLELAEKIWKKINPDKPFRYVSDPPFEYDVQKRIPDTTKAERLLGFKARVTLDDALDEIIPWIKKQIELGGI